MSSAIHKMSVAIDPAHFSNKLVPSARSTLASIGGCNFKCQFCGVRAVPFFAEDSRLPKTGEEIAAEMRRAMRGHKSIKIGGSGEPTFRPGQLRFLAETAKKQQAYVIVDTNGSRPNAIVPLVEEGLVDQVEVGIKGFTSEEAMRRSGTNDRRLAWDNPLGLIRTLVRNHPSTHVFPTFVVDADTSPDDIHKAFALFSHNVSSVLYMRFDTLIDPVTDAVIAALSDYVLDRPVLGGTVKYRVGPTLERFENNFSKVFAEALRNDTLSASGLGAHLRSYLRETYYPGFDFKPLKPAEMIAMIAGVARAYPEFENRVIIVSKPAGKYGEAGLVRLWLEIDRQD